MKTYFKNFHQASINWFTKRFDSASEIQEKAWPLIKAHQHTLIAAPTGSGKTLAAFYASIDSLVQKGLNGTLKQETEVLYVSPLKALSNDIEKNLRLPIQGIKDELKQLGLAEIQIKAAVRTGDTSQSDRTAMIKSPPHIIVSTPESLYLLLTSENGRKMLSTVNTIIVDEIHALVGNKRGSHLSLSLERLEHICQNKPVRIGLSATQKPIETVKNFLIGNRPDIDCKIIDSGHKRHLDLAIDLPDSPMTAVMANEVWDEIFDKLQNYIENHHTTLIFVNTRRLAERLAHTMSAKLGKGTVTAHHGSMSKEHRLEAEQNLKSGKLKALIATASLELGIDIGSVDLVCQIGSPRSIAAFLQRVGRSGHSVGLTPKGRLFPLTMDELVECAALFDAIRRGELDMIEMPEKPLDILAQHIVAEVANEEHDESTLFKLITSAWPYRDLTKTEFDETIKMLSEGFTTRRGRRAAYIHHDLVHEKLRARKGARLTALVSGGAIPDNFDYDIILEPAGTYIGTLNEDFAIESMPGDIFQ
ncbi:MAG: DEAD/DEAH box helicase, partial [Calditrichaeota bacterium]|nr:DEAD/DEAH box helicase [Calditrichota bacterium]